MIKHRPIRKHDLVVLVADREQWGKVLRKIGRRRAEVQFMGYHRPSVHALDSLERLTLFARKQKGPANPGLNTNHERPYVNS